MTVMYKQLDWEEFAIKETLNSSRLRYGTQMQNARFVATKTHQLVVDYPKDTPKNTIPKESEQINDKNTDVRSYGWLNN